MDATTTHDGMLVLSGRFDGRSTAQVRDLLYARIEEGGDVVVDLGAVDSIDVAAMRLLGAAGAVLDRQGRALVLRGCAPAVRRLLAVSRMRTRLQVESQRA